VVEKKCKLLFPSLIRRGRGGRNQMRENQLHNLPKVKGRRKYLRKNLTPAEAILWNYLKNSQLYGRKFRRQHSVGNYVLDFYCPEERLAVEIDGSQHVIFKSKIRQDKERTKFLNSKKIRIKRFINSEVYNNLDGVLEAIAKEFKPPLNPLLKTGGEVEQKDKNTFCSLLKTAGEVEERIKPPLNPLLKTEGEISKLD
jgi:very-short-patch-repair endonuclease